MREAMGLGSSWCSDWSWATCIVYRLEVEERGKAFQFGQTLVRRASITPECKEVMKKLANESPHQLWCQSAHSSIVIFCCCALCQASSRYVLHLIMHTGI